MKFISLSISFIIAIFLSCQTEITPTNQQNSPTELAQNFLQPTAAYKPKTWMHAMSGNMSKAGITKDLEAMAQVGIGGFLLFNVTQGIPNGDIIYNSPEHHEMLRHAAAEAERLDLSFGVHNCDGWSSSGGPWVTPEESMKMVVWSDTVVKGGQNIDLTLAKPTKRENFYQDIAILAYPALDSELADQNNLPITTASDNTFAVKIATDNRVDNESKLNGSKENPPWIQFAYAQPKTLRSVQIIFKERRLTAVLETSTDGKNFTTARALKKVRTGKNEWAIDDQFDPITAQYFRLQFNQTATIKDIQFSSTATIKNLLGQIAMARTEDVDLDDLTSPAAAMVINKNEILNLTQDFDASGKLQTQLPAGNWTITRFGYTATGAFNNPASEAGRGLEVDKLNRPAFKKHYDAFVKKVIENARPVAPNALQYVEIDSYEMGGQNWTDDFATGFQAEYGYNIIAFLPLIAGRYVDNAATSTAVLSDYRKYISDLMTENYFGYFAELCAADGIKSYIEPYGFGPLNDLDIGGKATIPMGEFWMNRPVTMAASAISSAHIYGKPTISAESFTSTPQINWKGHPAMAKTSGDLAWTLGINEFMFHRYAHQANTHVEPGMTMNRWGFHFDRTQTWWENAGAAWFKYIARGSYLLQQGHPVSDVLIYIGEGAPNSTFSRTDFEPNIPNTINFDNVNTDVLLNRLRAESGELVLPEGTTYQVLVLKNTERISLPTLKRLHELAKSDIAIYGDVPQQLAGYQHTESDQAEFATIQQQLSELILPITNWEAILNKKQLPLDFAVEGRADLTYAHRKIADTDVYFFYNPDSTANTFQVNFRVADKIPELWNPQDGSITKLAQFINNNGITMASIPLAAHESTFVVFRESARGVATILPNQLQKEVKFKLEADQTITAEVAQNGNYEVATSDGEWQFMVKDIPNNQSIDGNWQVTFADKNYAFEELIDWKDRPEEAIKYFAGTAAYRKNINLSKDLIRPNLNVTLDLGTVNIVAEVRLNGKEVATLWMPPFTIDITDFVKTGDNELEILVTNQWSNHLIGDERFAEHYDGYKLGKHGPNPDLFMPKWY
ncbi:MAG: glycosyl hydrolase, partial [Saprospiraceae bacterium]